ncbi:MAG TPA: DUF4271 domain-containing protein [Paludibacter sp.]|nr:DUF4271 domain-containing protein [Paludibacter sp.]
MALQDTIQIIGDSAKVFQLDSLAKADSLARADSLAVADSLHRADSLAIIARLNRGIIGTPHPSLPQTENWVFVALVVLFSLYVISASRSGGLVREILKNFFQTNERSSVFGKATVSDFWLRLLLVFFSTGVLSFIFYLNLYLPGSGFLVVKYLLFLSATWLFFGLKSLVMDVIGFVFLDPANRKMVKKSYFDTLIFLGIVLFPVLVLQVYAPSGYDSILVALELVLVSISFILIIIKLFQIFFHKTVATFYILLYLCTLEILPLIALYQVYKLLM